MCPGTEPRTIALRVGHARLVLALALRRPGAIIRRSSRRRRRHRRRSVDEVPLLERRDTVGAARLALDVFRAAQYLYRRHADRLTAELGRECDRLVAVLVDKQVRVPVALLTLVEAEVAASGERTPAEVRWMLRA